jgi:hypothetical protein
MKSVLTGRRPVRFELERRCYIDRDPDRVGNYAKPRIALVEQTLRQANEIEHTLKINGKVAQHSGQPKCSAKKIFIKGERNVNFWL